MENSEKFDFKPDPGWRTSFSMIVGVGWLVFLIIWLAFYATNYAWEQNFAIFLASILGIILLLGVPWGIWAIKKIPKEGKEAMKIIGFKWRIQTSIALPFIGLIFLIIWFWYYAIPYSVWQNIAVLLVTVLIIGGMLGSIWARWGVQHGDWNWEKHASSYYHHEKKSDDEVIDIEKKVDEKTNNKEE